MINAEIISAISSISSMPIVRTILNWIVQRIGKNKGVTSMINKFIILLSLKLDEVQGIELDSNQFREIVNCIKHGSFKNSEYASSLYKELLVKIQMQIQYIPELRIFIDLLLELADNKKVKLYRNQLIQLLTLITIIKEK